MITARERSDREVVKMGVPANVRCVFIERPDRSDWFVFLSFYALVLEYTRTSKTI